MAASNALLNLNTGRSQTQIRVLLWAGFGGVLLLMAVLGVSAISFLNQIERRQEQIRQDYVQRDTILERLRSKIYLSGTYFREFLLDSDETNAKANRKKYAEARDGVRTDLAEYSRSLRSDEEALFRHLNQEMDSYFDALDGAQGWNPQKRLAAGVVFMREEVLPRRMTAIGLTDQIQQIGESDLEASSRAVAALFASFRSKLAWMLASTIALALLLSGITLWRLLELERESAARYRLALKAQAGMKRLSAELVAAQESERRRISRELHDEVGQVLSAIAIAVGNMRSAMKQGDLEEAGRQADIVQEMVAENAKAVRNMSLLLRPTMLDDLGLLPALNWLARETSRSVPVRVDVSADPLRGQLPDEHRTCVYRVVQESIRNAVRHSGAQHIRIYVQEDGGFLRVSVQDDGKGFEPNADKGLGLVGMEERVSNLGGTFGVESQLGRGTIVMFQVPLPEPANPNTGNTPFNESVLSGRSTE